MNTKAILHALAAGIVAAAAHGQQADPAAPAVQRNPDFAAIARGGELYAQHCAACHGAQAQGAADWQEPGPDGKTQPPPLDGSGHAWHHPSAGLRKVIRDGGPGNSNMPAFRDVLTDPQINDIIAWFQSLWPDKAYQAWLRKEQRLQPRPGGN
ncbi:MAG: cytochrome c [Pseudomonadota bacterium]|nr:cytochrome c [Pseudomonadota bacterium]